MIEINRSLDVYRGYKEYGNKLKDKIVILVDDGIATGSTIFAAAQWVKAQKYMQLIIAILVGPKEIIEKLKEEVADVIIVINASESFEAVGEFYQDFRQVTDRDVKAIMYKFGYNPLGYNS